MDFDRWMERQATEDSTAPEVVEQCPLHVLYMESPDERPLRLILSVADKRSGLVYEFPIPLRTDSRPTCAKRNGHWCVMDGQHVIYRAVELICAELAA